MCNNNIGKIEEQQICQSTVRKQNYKLKSHLIKLFINDVQQ